MEASNFKNMNFLTTGNQSGLGRYVHETLGGMGLARNTPKSEHEAIKKNSFDAIIHCAVNSTKTFDPSSMYSYFQDNIFLTDELTSLKCKKFIYLSSVDVYCKDSELVSENKTFNSDNLISIYAATKLASESTIQRRCKNHLILRSVSPLGKYSRKNTLIKMIEDNPCTVGLSASSVYNIVIYSDILNFIKHAIDKDLQGVFNLASSGNIILGEIAGILKKNIHFGKHHYNVGSIDNNKIASHFPVFRNNSKDNLIKYLSEHNNV